VGEQQRPAPLGEGSWEPGVTARQAGAGTLPTKVQSHSSQTQRAEQVQ